MPVSDQGSFHRATGTHEPTPGALFVNIGNIAAYLSNCHSKSPKSQVERQHSLGNRSVKHKIKVPLTED